MRFNQILNYVFGQKSKLKILRFLSLYKKEGNVREISKEVGVTVPNTSRILKELEYEGVLTSKKIGRSILYSLNLKCYLVKEIISPLFKKEKETRGVLIMRLKKKLSFPIESIILFGSIEKGEEKPKSDVDLLFIVSDKVMPSKLEERILAVNNQIISEFGNSISPIIIKKSEFLKRLKKGDRLMSNILREGKVVEGKAISDIL